MTKKKRGKMGKKNKTKRRKNLLIEKKEGKEKERRTEPPTFEHKTKTKRRKIDDR